VLRRLRRRQKSLGVASGVDAPSQTAACGDATLPQQEMG
jgi:hypothetical protein